VSVASPVHAGRRLRQIREELEDLVAVVTDEGGAGRNRGVHGFIVAMEGEVVVKHSFLECE